MLKRMLGALACCVFALTLNINAEEGGEEGSKPKKEKKEKKKRTPRAKPKMEELTLTGKISKKETTRKRKEKEIKMVAYILTTTDGTVVKLPKPRAGRKKKGEDAPKTINLDDYVDKDVTVVAMGTKTTQKKKDKEIVRISVKKIKSITEGGAAAGGEEAGGEEAPKAE